MTIIRAGGPNFILGAERWDSLAAGSPGTDPEVLRDSYFAGGMGTVAKTLSSGTDTYNYFGIRFNGTSGTSNFFGYYTLYRRPMVKIGLGQTWEFGVLAKLAAGSFTGVSYYGITIEASSASAATESASTTLTTATSSWAVFSVKLTLSTGSPVFIQAYLINGGFNNSAAVDVTMRFAKPYLRRVA